MKTEIEEIKGLLKELMSEVRLVRIRLDRLEDMIKPDESDEYAKVDAMFMEWQRNEPW